MDSGSPSPGKGRSRAATKQPPTEPIDPRSEPVAPPDAGQLGPDPTNGNGNGNGSGTGRERANGAGGSSTSQRAKRRLAAAAAARLRQTVIDAPDAASTSASPADVPTTDPTTDPTTEAPAGPTPGAIPPPVPSSASTSNGGPALLPPIRTEPAGAPPARAAPAAPAVKPAVLPGAATVAAPSKVMPFIRPPAPPEVTPSELVAQKVAAPPILGAPLDVPLDPDPTAQVAAAERVGRPSITFQRRRTRPRVRRVTRVVRHIDTWSVFKVAVVFSAFFYAVALTAGVLLWHVAVGTGTVDNVERFFEGFGWDTFTFKGGEIYHNAWIAGLFVAIGLTGVAVLIATMFNLITDLVGGIRVSVLEEEVLARADRTAKVVVEDEPEATAPYDQARSG